MIFDIVKMTSRLYILKRIPGLISLTPLFIPWKLLKDAQHHYELCERTAAKRIETGNTDREDFMSYMLRHNDEKGISTPEILETSKAVILAGSETTATLLSGCTYQMLSNRHVYERLVKEIRSTFNSPEEITMSSVANLEYTAAVLNESLRICKLGTSHLPQSIYITYSGIQTLLSQVAWVALFPRKVLLSLDIGFQAR
jgi:cytochrome P450